MRAPSMLDGIVAGSVLLGGCGRDVQSVMAPGGIQAATDRRTGLAAVRVRDVRARPSSSRRHGWPIRGTVANTPKRWRRRTTVIALGIVFPAVTLTLLLGYGVWLTRSHLDLAAR